MNGGIKLLILCWVISAVVCVIYALYLKIDNSRKHK